MPLSLFAVVLLLGSAPARAIHYLSSDSRPQENSTRVAAPIGHAPLLKPLLEPFATKQQAPHLFSDVAIALHRERLRQPTNASVEVQGGQKLRRDPDGGWRSDPYWRPGGTSSGAASSSRPPGERPEPDPAPPAGAHDDHEGHEEASEHEGASGHEEASGHEGANGHGGVLDSVHSLAFNVVMPMSLALILCALLAHWLSVLSPITNLVPDSAWTVLFSCLLGLGLRPMLATGVLTSDRMIMLMAQFLNLFLLPVIIFESGWSLKHLNFFSQLEFISVFAVLGTLISFKFMG